MPKLTKRQHRLIDPDFLSAIKQRYHVIDMFQIAEYDKDFDGLEKYLLAIKKHHFDPNDRIIVVHFDTDYYIQNHYGIHLLNFFNVWKTVDIPLYTLLFYTNHVGIKYEIDTICQTRHFADQPTVIETFINPLNYSDATYNTEPGINSNQIEYHGLSLMGAPRSHRYALYNHLKHLDNQLVLTIKGYSI
jgi:hypothetical protein